MNQKSIYSPRVVVASQQGSVINIKSKQTGRVILKLKLLRSPYGEDVVLLDECCASYASYDNSIEAGKRIAAFEQGGAA